MKMKFLFLPAIGMSLLSSAVFAQSTVNSVETVLDAAIKSNDMAAVDAIAKYAAPGNPQIAAKVAAYKDEQAKKASAAAEEKLQGGFFDNWSGTGELGAYSATGNTSNTGISGGLGLTKEGRHWRYKFRALADYQRTSGVTSRNQATVAFEPNYKFNERLFAYGLAQYERDRFQGFTSRYTLSGGLGYKVINTDAMQLDVKAGPAWRKTKFTTGVSDSSIAGLGAMDFSWKISPNITFSENAAAYVQSGNSTFSALSAVTAKLSSAFSARLSYQVNHESNPPAGLKKTDTLSRVSLVYGF